MSEVSTAWNLQCGSEGKVVLLSVTQRWGEGAGLGVFFKLKRKAGPTLFFGEK